MNENELKKTRKAIGLTQAEMARKTKISIRAYKMYESGARMPKVDVAISIAHTLNSTVEALFECENSEHQRKEDL